MDPRKHPVATVFGVALVALILDASSGPGWGNTTAHTLLASRLEAPAASPLYHLLAAVFTTLVPAGEPGFRLGLLAALLGALTLAGVVSAARALLPRDPAAGVIAALLLGLAPVFREAAAAPSPSLLAAMGLVWATAFALDFVATERARSALVSVALCGFVIGATPWLGAAATVAFTLTLARAGAPRSSLAIVVGALGLLVVALWLVASGSVPGIAPGLGASLVATGRGAGAIVVGAGLAGVGFGMLTNLPRTRPLAVLVAVALVHEIVIGTSGPVLLAVCALPAAIIPSAVIRAASPSLAGLRRHALTFAAGLPLLGVAAATGATLSVENPGDAPIALASDLVDNIAPGSGIFVTTRPATWLAVQHEMVIAGSRPDLTLVPPLPVSQADTLVANALREHRVVGADAAAFGRLDIARALPRGRGFQLLGEVAPAPTKVPAPAHYRTAVGEEQAVLVTLERARFEAANGRLDAAARALGLESRFGAADLAILGVTVPTPARPALFGLLPAELLRAAPGPWLYDLFGDDLAWVANLPLAEPDLNAPAAKKLHARWRAILLGQATPDDPAIATLGDAAVRTTQQLFKK